MAPLRNQPTPLPPRTFFAPGAAMVPGVFSCPQRYIVGAIGRYLPNSALLRSMLAKGGNEMASKKKSKGGKKGC